jgi:hypothetical protein
MAYSDGAKAYHLDDNMHLHRNQKNYIRLGLRMVWTSDIPGHARRQTFVG